MCGVVGFNQGSMGTEQSQKDLIQSMMKVLSHRGPDGQHYMVTKSGTYIGHTRLYMRGGDGNVQPFDKNNFIYAVNGELYNNHVWLRTDAELMVSIPPENLIGEFAGACALQDSNSVSLIRDKFGIKPMFYYWEPGLFVFASEPQAILAHPLVKVTTSEMLDCAQLVNMPIPNTTYWKEIRAVPPGSMVVLTLHSPPHMEKYWDVPLSKEWRGVEPREIRERLQEAVDIRVKDNPCLCYVSSGMDGQIINHLARGESITCDFGDGDDYKQATYRVDAFRPIQMDACAKRACRTIYNMIGVAKWKLAWTARKEGYKAIISGQGADELFAGYQFFNSKPWSGLSTPDEVQHPAFQDIFGFTPQFLAPWLKLWESSIYYPKVDPFAVVAEMFSNKSDHHRLNIEQYLWIKTHFESQILCWGGDRPEMANSIEGRVPYLDLVDLAFSIPPTLRYDKQILRDAFGDVVDCKPKRSFMFPYRKHYHCSDLFPKPLEGYMADVAYWQNTTFNVLRRIYGSNTTL